MENDLFLQAQLCDLRLDVGARFAEGRDITAIDYLKAIRRIHGFAEIANDKLRHIDVLVTPTSPTVPFKIGERTDDPLQMYLSDVCTLPVNIAGVPAISVPCGFSDGLPVGLQIIGKPFDEATVLRVAHAFQQATRHHLAQPEL